MIKQLCLYAMLFLVFGSFTKLSAQNVYAFSITTLDGQEHLLSEYAGKKISIIIIPSTHTATDSLLLDSINIIASRYADSITVIGIPSYETGYADDSLSALTNYYDSLVQPPCIIAQGIATTRASAYQAPLFVWLTNELKNGHFNKDVEGVGQTFFIDSTGNLYGVFGPEQQFNDALMQKVFEDSDIGH